MVDKHIAALFLLDKTVPLGVVEPLHSSAVPLSHGCALAPLLALT
jgi:hypothetical protein